MAAPCDITDPDAVAGMIAAIEQQWGRVNVLVNNAAVMTKHALFLEKSIEQCDQEIRVTLYGTINCVRAVLPGMIERSYGKIVNIATDAARIGQEREAVYAAAKGRRDFLLEIGRQGSRQEQRERQRRLARRDQLTDAQRHSRQDA